MSTMSSSGADEIIETNGEHLTETSNSDNTQTLSVVDENDNQPNSEIFKESSNNIDPESLSMQAMVEEVRTKFFQDIETNGADQYDSTDIELIRNDNWQVERFIRRKKSVDASVEMLKNTLRWRHQMLMPQLQDTDFPEEFFKVGAMFGYENDLSGNGCVYLRVRLHRKIKELETHIKSFMMHIVNKVDMACNGKGLTVVFDCSGAGLTNLDMDLIWFLVDSLIKYYPYGMEHILVYEMPWILSSAWTIIKAWMAVEFRDKIKFVSRKTITDFIANDHLPYYMGGTCPTDYHHVPKGCRPAEVIAQEKGISEKDVKKIMKSFKPFLEEAQQEIDIINSLKHD